MKKNEPNLRPILQMTAIGDAIGAGYEYIPQDQVEGFKIDWGFRQHPKHTEIEPGMFTDDTMLSFAAARAMATDMKNPKNEKKIFRSDTLAQTMVDQHRDYRTTGYSKHMLSALDAGTTGADLETYFDTNGRTDSNGAAMRSAVYGLIPSLPTIMACTWTAARLTHDLGGLSSAQAVAVASHFLVHKLGPKADLGKFLREHVGTVWTLRFRDRVTPQNGPLGLITVAAALTIVQESQTLTEVLEESVRIGGDVDTVAAIAMALAGSSEEIVDDLPDWIEAGIKPVAGITFGDLRDWDFDLTMMLDTGLLG